MLAVTAIESLTAVVRPGEADLSWLTPEVSSGASITDYVIQYQGGGDQPWITFPDGVSTATETVVAGLTSGESYNFRVAAIATTGQGPWSDSLRRVLGFNNEFLLAADWTAAGAWRLESEGVRLTHHQASLTSRNFFGSETQLIEFSYQITDRTQMWISLWGETFVFEPPAGGGDTTAWIARNGEAVTFGNEINEPMTVILKQANKDVATPMVLQMDQRNLYRPTMELLLKQVSVTKALPSTATVPRSPATVAASPARGQGAIQLSWAAPDDGGSPIIDYLIQYRATDEDNWLDFSDGLTDGTFTLVSWLDREGMYAFRVAAVNAVGVSPWSVATVPVKPGWLSLPMDIRHYAFGHEELLKQSWTTAGSWRLESDGTRLMHFHSSLTARQSGLGTLTRSVKISYEITPNTQLWVSLWGETFSFEAPANGGSAVAEIIRNGNAVTFGNGLTAPTTVILKEINKNVATPMHIQMDQRNLSRPSMELLVKRVDTAMEIQIAPTPPNAPSVAWAAPVAGGSDINVFWTEPGIYAMGSLDSITDYVIQYSEDAGATWLDYPTGVSTETHDTVTNLAPGTEYVFRVAAVNGRGVGSWSPATAPTRTVSFEVLTNTHHHSFGHQQWMESFWMLDGTWRLESGGVRLMHHQASLTSRQTFGSDTHLIEFSYEITERTQMWVSLWGETFVFESPPGGGAATARIIRNGEAVTFDDGVTSPTTVILKQVNANVATPLFLQMDQRNLYRPTMELLLKQVVVVQENQSFAERPIVDFLPIRNAYTRSGDGWRIWNRTSYGFGEEQDFYVFEYGKSYLIQLTAGGVYHPVETMQPKSPSLLQVAPGTRGRDIDLFWTAPGVWVGDPMGSITDYLIQYSTDAGASWIDHTTATSAGTHDTVTNLDPDAEYMFRVAAVSGRGTGDWSPSSAATRPSPPVASAATRHFGFSHEHWLREAWTPSGIWRMEEHGARLQHWSTSLTSRQTFGRDTQLIEFSYEITDHTQMWVSLWGETFVFEPPTGGGAVTARISRAGEAVTFGNGVTAPTTVILKQANKDVATPLFLQMDQRNLYRPSMDLLIKRVTLQAAESSCIVNVDAGELVTDALRRSGSCQLVKRGDGILALNQANAHSGGTVVEAGELVIRNAAALGTGKLKVLPGARVLLDLGNQAVSLSRLEIAPAGTINLATGSLLIAPGGYDLGAIRSLIATARGNGWSGPGITSSSIQPGTSREVGYRVVQDDSLLVGFSAVGDANMDGSVNVQDLIAISTSGKYGSGATNAAWWEGDFNYDGVVDITDLINLSTSGLYGSGSYLPATSAAEMGTSSVESNAAELAVTGTTAAPVEALEQPVRQKQGDPPTQVTPASPALSPASGMHRVEKLAWAAMTNTIEGVSWNDQKPSRPRTAVR